MAFESLKVYNAFRNQRYVSVVDSETGEVYARIYGDFAQKNADMLIASMNERA